MKQESKQHKEDVLTKGIMKFLVLGCCLILIASTTSTARWYLFESPLLGKEAVKFSLSNGGGKVKSLADLRQDDPAVILFWTTWCPHCRTNLKSLHSQKDKIAQKNIRIILVNIGEDVGYVKDFLKKNEVDFEVLYDEQNQVAEDYAIYGIPTYVLIDEKGVVKMVENRLPEDYEDILLGE